MVKSIKINPEKFLEKKVISNIDIRHSFYDKSIDEEIKSGNLNLEDLKEIYSQMIWIRKFEELLSELKTTGQYNGIEYKYNGPAHLAIGQEAAIVGSIFNLDINDHIYGTHRSHGEVLSKCFSAIYHLDDFKQKDLFKGYNENYIFNSLKGIKFYDDSVTKDKNRISVIFSMLSEIFAKKTGLNKGIAGGMHMFFPKLGSFPNNAIIGGSFALAFGSALYKLINKKEGISVAFIGDGAVSSGPVWETLNMSVMDQFTTLWEDKKYPPFMVNILNNNYAISAQTNGETMGNGGPARIGLGVHPSGLDGESVNGQDVFAVLDLVRRKKDIVISGKNPVVNEIRTYRFDSHQSHNFQDSYRTNEEIQEWKEYDPIEIFKNNIINSKIVKDFDFDKIEVEINNLLAKIFNLAIDDIISPLINFENDAFYIRDIMFNRSKRENYKSTRFKLIDNDRYKDLQNKEDRNLTISDSIFEATIEKAARDDKFIVFSQDSRFRGGLGGVYNGLNQSLPFERLFNTPINESAMLGTAIGYAMEGGSCMVQITYMDFLFRAGDELASQLSKWTVMSGGYFKLPIVVRIGIFHGSGVQHSEDYTNILSSITGLNIAMITNPYNAKGIMNKAFSLNSPSIIIEDTLQHRKNMLGYKVPLDYYEIDLGNVEILKEGTDLTIVAFGTYIEKSLSVSKILEEHDISAEVININWIVPLNYEKIFKSVKKTKKIILLNHGFERMNVMKEISSTIVTHLFEFLIKPPIVMGAKNLVTPNGDYDNYIYPQIEDILSAINDNLIHIKDYKSTNFFDKNKDLELKNKGM